MCAVAVRGAVAALAVRGAAQLRTWRVDQCTRMQGKQAVERGTRCARCAPTRPYSDLPPSCLSMTWLDLDEAEPTEGRATPSSKLLAPIEEALPAAISRKTTE